MIKISYVLAIDQGTSSTRALVVNHDGKIVAVSQKEHRQIYPQTGYVEHDPLEIWGNTNFVCDNAVKSIGGWDKIKCIGITNQRETVVTWDEKTGNTIGNAIVWQCRRSVELIEALEEDEVNEITKRTGLLPDAYFSASKMEWLIEYSSKVRSALLNESLRFGTIDSFLVHKMTGKHITDISNASRTMLFNIIKKEWDDTLLSIFKIPKWCLPEVTPSSWHDPELYWVKDGSQIPITGLIGDQQSALFGQSAFDKGAAKITYGTGNFALENIGRSPNIYKKNAWNDGLLTTVGWGLKDLTTVTYAVEGSVFITGALVQWLRDELSIIKEASEIEQLARQADDTNENLVIVPAFSGLGAPYWNQNARGTILGITRGTTKNHLAKAALESIAFQTHDIIEVIEQRSGHTCNEVKVDGGASKNNYLMQLQADILNKKVSRPKNIETTALGAAFLAGLGLKFWDSLEVIKTLNPPEITFSPKSDYNREKKLNLWKKAIKRSFDWH